MDIVRNFVNDNALYLSAGAVGVLGLTWIMKRRSKSKVRVCGVDYPKDTVILHIFGRTKGIPNLGHFVMKLETYLRVTKIPYQVDFNYRNGPKNKTPWIEYNGVTMGDSQLIVEFLNKEFSVNMNDHLSAVETSQAWAIQKWLEEFTYWMSVHTRWGLYSMEWMSNIMGLSGLTLTWMKYLVLPQVRKATYAVGIGRHSNTEISEMIKNDVRHFATLLGNKKYVMGDKMSLVDCAAFGILSEIRWATPEPCPGRKLLLEQKNIMEYLDRIKQTYWPDWDTLEISKNPF